MTVLASAQLRTADDPLQKIRVSVKNNRLVFATRADYELAVNESKPELRERIFGRLKTLNGFTSLAATSGATQRTAAGKPNSSALIADDNDDDDDDDDFQSILNPNHVVQIGDFIFKINPATEKVYVLPASHEAEYADLIAERTLNRNIRQFSTNDAVLDLLESGQANERCKESGIGRQKITTDIIPVGDDSIMGILKYTRTLGIFFSLKAILKMQGKDPATTWFDLAPVYYHVRCGDTVGPYSVSHYDKRKYHSYQGSTPLNEVYVRGRFHGESTVSGTNYHVTRDSDWLEMRVNYTAPPPGLPPDGLTYPHYPGYIVGQYSLTYPELARGPATSWSISPPLPPGLAINPTTGVIAGVPTAPPLPGANYIVTASNDYGSTIKVLYIAVTLPGAPSSLTYPVNPAIYVKNQDVTTNVPKYNGGKATSWSVTPDLPPGLTLEHGFDSTLNASGYIYGRPITAQPAKAYTITASNAGGSTSTTLTIEVRDPAAALSGLKYSQNPATYTLGTLIPVNTPTLATGVPYSGFTVTPALPDGLMMSKYTGEIRGTPTQSQPTKIYTVTATAGNSITSVQLRIAVAMPSNTSGGSSH